MATATTMTTATTATITTIDAQLDVQRMWNDPNAVNGGARIIPNGDPVKCVEVVPPIHVPGKSSRMHDMCR